MANPSADSVKVAVRIRPLSRREKESGCRIVVEQPSLTEPQVVIGNGISGKPEIFTFNYVFPPEDSQEHLYESSVKPLLAKLNAGYNVTILAYGQTGSGKTFTMGTNYDGQEDPRMGVIPRAINDIFDRIETTAGETETSVTCSFMELYQENLYDLLSTKGSREERVVDIREANNQIIIPGLTETRIKSADETFEVLMQGSQERAVASTAMNAMSSRSHAIFTINMTNRSRGEKPVVTTSKFHLVDLAGSERPKKTQATGERFKEGVKINQGLLVLGNVISALGSAGGPQGHVPYRESKLTRLLQDSLGGNSLTLMVACVSPADYNCDETINTLRYANRAKNIRNKAVINQDPNQAEIRRLKAIIQELRLELLSVTVGGKELGGGEGPNRPLSVPGALPGMPGFPRSSSDQLPAEAARRERELVDKIRTLQQQLQTALQDIAADQLTTLTAEKIVNETEALLAASPDCELKRAVQAILNDYKKETASIRSESATSDALLQSEDFQNRSYKHTQKQMGIRDELRQLNKELELKEELHRRCMGNIRNMTFTVEEENATGGNERMQKYETKIVELEKQIANLNNQLNTTKTVDKKSKLAEELRKKVQALELELAEVRKKSVQQAKLIQLKEKDTQRVENLSQDIQTMKATRDKLVKDMRTESENFRQWKINREKEICQLREKDRKLKNEMVRMQSVHVKQQNVLKRKVEEAVAVNRRLKDALERQKHVQAQRAAGKPVRGKDVTSWVDDELELIRSVKEASVTLKLLMDDRALLNRKLLEMKETPHDEEAIKQQELDLELRNAQIADLQQKIISTDVETRQKAILEGIPTLSEAKQVIKKIMQVFSDHQEETANVRHQQADARLSIECLEETVRQLTADLAESKHRFVDETNDLAKMYEEKLAVLLQSRETASTSIDIDSIFQEASDRIVKLRQELESMKFINDDLTKQLAEAQANAFGKRRTRNSNRTAAPELVEYEEDDEEAEEDAAGNTGDDSDLERDPDFRRLVAFCQSGCSTKRCGGKKLVEFCCEAGRYAAGCVNRRIDEQDDEHEGDADASGTPVLGERELPLVLREINADNKQNVAMKKENEQEESRLSVKRKLQDDSGEAGSTPRASPNREKDDILTPTYIYSDRPRKPLLDDF